MRFSKGRFSNSIIRRREYDNPSVFCCRKSLPLEGKVPRNEADEVSDSRKQHLISQPRCQLPLKGKPLFSIRVHLYTAMRR